jgi:glycosyl transferase family 61
MSALTVIRPSRLRAFAEERGLEICDLPWQDAERYELPPVASVWGRSARMLAPLQLQKQRNFVVRFAEAFVYAGNLAVAYEGALLPGGYAHSWNWVTYESGFVLAPDAATCNSPEAQTVALDGDTTMLGMASHFGHFFIDCLDRVMALPQLPRAAATTLLADGPMPPAVREMAALAGFDESQANLVHGQPGRRYAVKNLCLVTLASVKPALAAGNMALLRQRVLEALHPAARPDSSRLYLGRRGVARRKVINQEALERMLVADGYRSFYPEAHSLAETVATFFSAQTIVLAYGSAKFNLMFCRPGTRVICLVPQGADTEASAMFTLRHLCAIFGLELSFCIGRVVGPHLGHHSDIEVDEANLAHALGLARQV